MMVTFEGSMSDEEMRDMVEKMLFNNVSFSVTPLTGDRWSVVVNNEPATAGLLLSLGFLAGA